MFRVNKQTKTLEKVEQASFKDVACKERQDLQEWIVSNPGMLGEEFLIIQKEFAGFADTKERLDLLALDNKGNLIIIENKLDDSGRDVVWQAIKYASYCSTLTKDEIRTIFQKYLDNSGKKEAAENLLTEFFDKNDFADLILNQEGTQRIIFVAKEFRPEVTSAVTWLMKYGIKIVCIKVVPYKLNEEILLDVEQIIPQKETEDFTIKLQNKSIEERQQITDADKKRWTARKNFWTQFLPEFQKHNSLFSGISPTEECWVGKSCGMPTASYTVLCLDSYAGVQLTIDRGSAVENKFVYDEFLKYKEEIEKIFGAPLNWERMDSKKGSRISLRDYDFCLRDEGRWSEINAFLIDNMTRLHKAISPYIDKVRTALSTYAKTQEQGIIP